MDDGNLLLLGGPKSVYSRLELIFGQAVGGALLTGQFLAALGVLPLNGVDLLQLLPGTVAQANALNGDVDCVLAVTDALLQRGHPLGLLGQPVPGLDLLLKGGIFGKLGGDCTLVGQQALLVCSEDLFSFRSASCCAHSTWARWAAVSLSFPASWACRLASARAVAGACGWRRRR
ncbi:hypothetical protein ACFSHR_26965 [Azotobacter chroococcum]